MVKTSKTELTEETCFSINSIEIVFDAIGENGFKMTEKKGKRKEEKGKQERPPAVCVWNNNNKKKNKKIPNNAVEPINRSSIDSDFSFSRCCFFFWVILGLFFWFDFSFLSGHCCDAQLFLRLSRPLFFFQFLINKRVNLFLQKCHRNQNGNGLPGFDEVHALFDHHLQFKK